MIYTTIGNKHITENGILYTLEITSDGSITLAIADLTGSTSVVDHNLFSQYISPKGDLDLRTLCENYRLDYPVINLLFREIEEIGYFDFKTVH